MTHRSLPTLAVLYGLFACGAAPAAAAPADLLRTTASTNGSTQRSCSARALPGNAGVVQKAIAAPATGWLTVRLAARSGDWDLAVFERRSGRLVAGATSFGAREVASGVVFKGDRLVVQACRRSRAARSAGLRVGLARAKTGRAAKSTLVRVSVANRARLRQLQRLGLDMTEHGGKGFVDVVVHGVRDRRALRKANFISVVRVRDLGAADSRRAAKDRAYAAAVQSSGLPSGRTTYRRLVDYGNDMKALVDQNQGLVRPITLPFKTYEGRMVEGIEITEGVGARDGKPVFLMMGVHHAREWPSGEHAMEWAFELVNGYKSGNARAAALVRSARTIVVPIVNPDGFNTSREAGGATNGRGGANEIANIVAAPPGEYRRKNCRLANDSDGGSCLQPSAGLAEPGVDPNRNYGGFWGGPGASTTPTAQDYRGPGPFSEPETRNIRDLVSKRQVTALITNHTYSNLVLRPPGVAGSPPPPDEPAYKALGDSMAAENGYKSQPSHQLYDTTGSTEDWTYWSTGGFGFTFEIGPRNFHPPFAEVVAEYEGTTPAAGTTGGGNREAYFKAMQAAVDPAKHSVIEGRAPAGAVLRLTKTFQTLTSPVIAADGTVGEPRTFPDSLETTMVVPASGRFEWHANPSTRPVVAQSRGRDATGEPSPPVQFAGGAQTASPCADFDTTDPACWNDHPFTVPSGPGIDNAKASVRVQWATIASDWDMKIFRDTDGDGTSVGEAQRGETPVGTSGSGTTDSEATTISEPALEPGAKYVVRVMNWAATEPYDGTVTFQGPDPFVPAQVESWTLTCERPEGTVRTTEQVTIARGERKTLRLGSCGRGG